MATVSPNALTTSDLGELILLHNNAIQGASTADCELADYWGEVMDPDGGIDPATTVEELWAEASKIGTARDLRQEEIGILASRLLLFNNQFIHVITKPGFEDRGAIRHIRPAEDISVQEAKGRIFSVLGKIYSPQREYLRLAQYGGRIFRRQNNPKNRFSIHPIIDGTVAVDFELISESEARA